MATAVAAAKGPKELTFSWEGKDKAGKVIRGELRAVSQAAVNATLRRQGILVQKVKPVKRKGGGIRRLEGHRALHAPARDHDEGRRAAAAVVRDREQGRRQSRRWQSCCTDIKTDVETGSALAAAFRKFPLYFDNLYCNLVQAGEQAGILETLLDRLATYQEKTLAIKSKIKSALFYPIAIIAVAFIITAVIMIFVIPAFKEVFTNFGADLPAPTLIVMAISDWFVANWYIIFPVIGGGIYGFLEAWKRSVAVQIFMDRLMLRVPVFGHLVRISTIARWTRTLSTMFAAGVPLVEALDSVGGASGNYVYAAGDQADQAGSLHRHLAHRGDAERQRVPDHGDPDGVDRRGDRRARRHARARWPTSSRPRWTTRWRRCPR